MQNLIDMLVDANDSKNELLNIGSDMRNKFLLEFADELMLQKSHILNANELDIKIARDNQMSESMIDRLALNEKRINSMYESIHSIVKADDCVGQVIGSIQIQDELIAKKIRVPFGVIAIIYESRPNVFVDSVALCIKSANIPILRGSSNAINSNMCLYYIARMVLEKLSMPKSFVNFIEDTDRAVVDNLIKQVNYIDILIPRGGKGLKNYIAKNALIPVIETGDGICHLYVDEYYDVDMVSKIAINAKTQRPATCNSIETILYNEEVLTNDIAKITDDLIDKNVEIRYTQDLIDVLKSISYNKLDKIKLATVDDFSTEYHDLIISGKIVKNVKEAVEHINNFSTNHSETIITKNLSNAKYFFVNVDSAVVYHNASTRFSDGGEFGFGGEIGISTQKLHARGPMGLNELTTYKYIVEGAGNIRV